MTSYGGTTCPGEVRKFTIHRHSHQTHFACACRHLVLHSLPILDSVATVVLLVFAICTCGWVSTYNYICMIAFTMQGGSR